MAYLPYVKGLSEKIQRICHKLQLRTIFKLSNTLRKQLVHVKAPIATEKRKGVVYEVSCKDYEYVYIGETKRILKKRLPEHKAAVKKGDEKYGITIHVWKKDHDMDWD